MKPLLFVADAHLTREDPEVDLFIEYLGSVGPRASTLAILGDLFNLWLGTPKFYLSHHSRVIEALGSLRKTGTRIIYVEGNRDFYLRRAQLGRAFDAVAEDSLTERHAGWLIHATHGDAINLDDRPYRAWKAFSKSLPIYGLFSLLPGAVGMKVGERLERSLSGTNVRHKSTFPTEHCISYASRAFERGCHAVVMGHFHEERFIPCGEKDGRQLGVYVLPSWRDGHRYLVFEGDSSPAFAAFEP